MQSSSPAMGAVNWLGLWTLYVKEVRRFLKVVLQTVAAPAITTLLFLAVFYLALGGARRAVGDLPYPVFLAPGLMMMAIVQNAFANTSSSLMIAKVQGNIVDMLMPPLTPGELLVGLAGGGVTRGLLVGLVVGLVILPFVPLAAPHPLAAIYFAVSASLLLSLIGILAGIWADKFDQVAGITNFVVTPLAFLSGTFYSVERLPEPFLTLAHVDPFFYMIDGFRWSLTGHADGPVLLGAGVLLAVNVALWVLCHRLLVTGYKLKS